MRMRCVKSGWNWPSGYGEDDFSSLLIYFCNFVIISQLKRICTSFEQTWIPFTQGYFVISFVVTGPVVLEKKIFKICQCIFSNFVMISPWKWGRALHLNKFESPSPKDDFCQVTLKLAQRFWKRRYFRNIVIISPWKRAGPFIWTN